MNLNKLVVWDVDGTLVDSRHTIFEAAKESFAELGEPVPAYDQVRQIVGLGLREALGVLMPHRTGVDLDRAVEAYRKAFQGWFTDPTFAEPLYPGAEDTLRRLRADGWKTAMATGKSRRGVENVIRSHDWADLFDTTHCSDDGPGKPHPAMLLEAMRAVGCPPERTIMIGDTAHDMRMAKSAGCYAQGVSWGFHTAAEIRAGGADDIADDFAILNSQLDWFSDLVSSPA